NNSWHYGEAWRQPVIKCIRRAWREVLFQQQLEHVREGLEKPGGPNAIRAYAVLDKRADPTLCIDCVRHHEQNYPQQNCDLQQRGDNKEPVHKVVASTAEAMFPVRLVECWMDQDEFAPDLVVGEHSDVQPGLRSLVRLIPRRSALSGATLQCPRCARRDRRFCLNSTRRTAGLFR